MTRLIFVPESGHAIPPADSVHGDTPSIRSWNHWAQGRGRKSVGDVILEQIDDIRKNPDAIRKRCEEVSKEAQDEHLQRERPLDQPHVEVGQSPKHEIQIQLPASAWGEACQQVGLINDDPVCTDHLLAALILESESWKQKGNAEEFNSGWYQDVLASSLTSLTATTSGGLSLAREEKRLVWIVAVATVVGALAAVASAVAAWFNP